MNITLNYLIPNRLGPGGIGGHQQGQLGISLWDVSNPAKPHPLKQNFLDFPVHNTFAWTTSAGNTYLLIVDDVATNDLKIANITKPQAPKLITTTGTETWLATNPDPVHGISPQEGNAHAAVFAGPNFDKIFGGDEDFDSLFTAVTVEGDVYQANQGSDVPQIGPGADIEKVMAQTAFVGQGCGGTLTPAADVGAGIALIERSDCTFTLKAQTVEAAGSNFWARTGDTLNLRCYPGGATPPGESLSNSDHFLLSCEELSLRRVEATPSPLEILRAGRQNATTIPPRQVSKLGACVPPWSGRFLVGLRRWFEKRGIHNLVELDWWQSTPLAGKNEVFCLPAQHFSGRTATDTNTSLWCSWLLEMDGFRFYFGGDTGGDCGWRWRDKASVSRPERR